MNMSTRMSNSILSLFQVQRCYYLRRHLIVAGFIGLENMDE
jgi:hypothetical protein